MRKHLTHTILTLVIIFLFFPLSAQNEVEMADTMRSEGKIYVVVAILLLILAGLIAYVFAMDKKISRLENKIDSKG